MASSMDEAFTADDHLLDHRVWRTVIMKKNGVTKKFYSNVITGKSFENLSSDQFRTFTNEEVETLRERWKGVIHQNRNTLFRSGFGRLSKEETSNVEESSVSMPSQLLIMEDDDVMDISCSFRTNCWGKEKRYCYTL